MEKELDVSVTSKILWTDSQCTLQWLQSTKPLPVFVTNRLKETTSLHGVDFRYVPTEDNPADIATRGKTPLELSSSIWWTGPHWLRQEKSKWPKWKIPETKVDMEAEGTNKVFYEAILIVGEGSYQNNKDLTGGIGNLIKEQSISTLWKLLRITAWLLRFTDKLMRRTTESGPLTALELQRAKLIWDLYIQNRCYPQVIQSTKQGKKSDLGNKLNLVIDNDGLLRCKGRYDNVNLTDGARYPKLLHKSEHYTRLVIEDYHSKLLHSGVSQTLAHTRKEYWIPHGRSKVKKVLNQCRVCRRTEGNPYKMSRMPPWPKERVNEALPFEHTGLDYFGPLYVKQYPHASDQKTTPEIRKVWVCLFTCLVVRAIHLEIVEDMSADQFLLCLRRFIARRGTPRQIISDNAKQFKSARKVLNKAHQEAILNDKVQDYVTGHGIQWSLIVDLAPWMGGFYERLVGITKRTLRKTLGVNCFTLTQLTTILTEVEAVVNSRPLVYVADDIKSSHVLVPSDFLSMNSNNVIQGYGSEEKDKEYQPNVTMSNAEKLLKVWKWGQRKLKQFWELWRNDYLLSLRERTQMSLKGPKKLSHNAPQVGDVVLIKENLPRGRWRVGVIRQLIRGKDQMIRSARVLVSPNRYLHRALSLLYPIECPGDKSMQCDHNQSDTLSGNNEGEDRDSLPGDVNNEELVVQERDAEHITDESSRTVKMDMVRRPVRQATLKAKRKMQEWLNPTDSFICVGNVAIAIANTNT